MIRPFGPWLLLTALLASSAVLAAPPPDPEPDWDSLRRDVDAQSRRPQGNGDFEARRQLLRERARARFAEADRNRDGYWSREEMARLRPGMARHFDRIDRNGDGLASEGELIAALRMQRRFRGNAPEAQPPHVPHRMRQGDTRPPADYR